MYGNIAFIFMCLIYSGLTFMAAVLAWSRGFNAGRSEGYERGRAVARHIANGTVSALNDY
jgi:hypothetical protein